MIVINLIIVSKTRKNIYSIVTKKLICIHRRMLIVFKIGRTSPTAQLRPLQVFLSIVPRHLDDVALNVVLDDVALSVVLDASSPEEWLID